MKKLKVESQDLKKKLTRYLPPSSILFLCKIIRHGCKFKMLFVTNVMFAASTTGSMFRIQIGNQVEVDPEEIHVTFDDVKGVS
jgi:hypothetical protein